MVLSICEAIIWMNLLSITQQQDGTDNPSLMSTVHYKLYSVKPDYCIIFLFSEISAFNCVWNCKRDHTPFEWQYILGNSLGCSEFTNSMFFYNPNLDSFCTSENYLIENNCNIGEPFTSI